MPTRANLIAGPITDLNVMTRRGRVPHSVERLAVSGAIELAAGAGATLILCHEGRVRAGGTESATLGSLDALRLDPGRSSIRLTSDGPATIFVIRIGVVGQND